MTETQKPLTLWPWPPRPTSSFVTGHLRYFITSASLHLDSRRKQIQEKVDRPMGKWGKQGLMGKGGAWRVHLPTQPS